MKPSIFQLGKLWTSLEVSTSWKVRKSLKGLVCIVISVGNQMSRYRHYVWLSANSTGIGWKSQREHGDFVHIYILYPRFAYDYGNEVPAAILCQTTIAGPGPASNRTGSIPCKFIQSHFLVNWLNQLSRFSHRFSERDDELLVIASFKKEILQVSH